MSNKVQCEIFIRTLTEMVQAQRRQKDALLQHQCRTYSDRLQTRPQNDAAWSLRPTTGKGDARGAV